MKLENEFVVNVPVDRAWEVLTDIPEIAPCLPGARLTGQEGNVYTGKVKIKVGPVTAEYAGTADFLTLDKDNYHVEIDAKGRDKRGSGNASAVITADMVPVDDGTQVTIVTDLKISGKVAQFGRGVIGDVSEKLIGQFVECIEAKLDPDATSPEDAIEQVASTPTSTPTSTSTPESTSAASPVTDPVPAPAAVPASERVAAMVEDAAASTAGNDADASAAVPTSRTFEQPEEELEALDLMDAAGGAVFKRFIPLLVGVVVVLLVIWFATRG